MKSVTPNPRSSNRRILTGLLGAPIAHSAAPAMHERAAETLGLRCHYQLVEVAGAGREELKVLLEGVRRLGFAGINVTFPYKEAVLDLLDELSPGAARIGAVNTVIVRDGRLTGHNTDTTGFARAIAPLVTASSRGPVAVIGAGGVGKAIAFALAALGVGELRIFDREHAKAAHLAARWGWYAESIAMLAQAGEWDDVPLRYPRPYPDAVAMASELAGVPADWILGVMRQESLYRKDAVSRADARGLMQMLPPTAAAVARRWHLPSPRNDDLFDPSVAVPLGAAYLRELLNRHAGQLDVSLAAYNAGASAVARWLPPKPMDADVWIENIPYTETRAYVQHIFEHIVAFAHVSGAEPPHLDALMPAVEPPAPVL